MKCEHCNSNIDSIDAFCGYCGNKNKKAVMYCNECGSKFREDDIFCRQCGTKKKQKVNTISAVPEDVNETPRETIKQEIIESEINDNVLSNEERLPEEVPVFTEPNTMPTHVATQDNHFKNRNIWLISITLLLMSNVLSSYIRRNSNDGYNFINNQIGSYRKERSDIENSDIENFEIEQETTAFMQQSNINMNGYSFYYEETFYLAVVDGVIAYTQDFQEEEKILDENVSYIHVDETYLYYQRWNYDYYRMHLETKETEKLLDNIFYPQHVDGMLYFQDDSDGESMYRYNFATQESTKLNTIRSFQSFVDVAKNSIYYIGLEDDEFSIYKMDLDGQNNEILVKGIGTAALNYDGTYLYYSKDGIIYSYDVTAQEHKGIREDNPYQILLIDDSLVSWDYFNDILRKIEDNQTGEIISRESVFYLQVIGEYFICWILDGGYGTVYVLDIHGNCAFLTKDYKLDDLDNDDYDYENNDNREENNIFEL